MPRLPFRTRFLLCLLLTPVLVAGVAHEAQAGPAVTVVVSGPAVLNADSDFDVAVTGDDTGDVCRVQEELTQQADTAAPYSLPITLSSLPAGPQTLTFYAVACDNRVLGSATATIDVPVHVTSSTRWVAPAATDPVKRLLDLSVTARDTPVSAAILSPTGAVVATLPARSSSAASWTWAPSDGTSATPAGDYTLAVTSGSAEPDPGSADTVTLPLTVTAGWAPMSPPFARCTTLTWSYSSAGQPARAAGMAGDVASAFTRIQRATGIRFTRVARKGTITLGWKDLGAGGPDGRGGATWSGDTALSGQVLFNTRSTWVGLRGFRRQPGGMPGRGALITHELGHVLGLDHVTDRSQVMYPVAGAGSPLGLSKGDRAGLRALYPTCS